MDLLDNGSGKAEESKEEEDGHGAHVRSGVVDRNCGNNERRSRTTNVDCHYGLREALNEFS